MRERGRALWAVLLLTPGAWACRDRSQQVVRLPLPETEWVAKSAETRPGCWLSSGDAVVWELPPGPARRVEGVYESSLSGQGTGKLEIALRSDGQREPDWRRTLNVATDAGGWNRWSVALPSTRTAARLEITYRDASSRRGPVSLSRRTGAALAPPSAAADRRALRHRHAARRSRLGVRIQGSDDAAARPLLPGMAARGDLPARGQLDAALARLALSFPVRGAPRRRARRSAPALGRRDARGGGRARRVPDARRDGRGLRRSRLRIRARLRPVCRAREAGPRGRREGARDARRASGRAGVSLSPHLPGARLHARGLRREAALRQPRAARARLAGDGRRARRHARRGSGVSGLDPGEVRRGASQRGRRVRAAARRARALGAPLGHGDRLHLRPRGSSLRARLEGAVPRLDPRQPVPLRGGDRRAAADPDSLEAAGARHLAQRRVAARRRADGGRGGRRSRARLLRGPFAFFRRAAGRPQRRDGGAAARRARRCAWAATS